MSPDGTLAAPARAAALPRVAESRRKPFPWGSLVVHLLLLACVAVSENKDVALLMGINVNAIIVATFAIGAAMAGAAGVLYGLMFRQVAFYMGFVPGIKAFTAAVLGGIGNIPGAMVGGLVLGVMESVGPALFLEGLGIPRANQLQDVLAYTMLVMILLFRPSGILGEVLTEKKA